MKASIKSCEVFVRIISNETVLPIDLDYSYLIRKDFIRLVALAQVVGYEKKDI